ncbi:CPBP family intramembrane glutamic endopeptidase [Rubrivirga sp. S365]|uniref:CPBP family intramembrane glutamic endopeptidase n=1 Tax=Rubrivirga litoralis TaxID=3075598 RepID=A0ABU3BS45_9BACT|nr:MULTISPECIES: CPBP family intramembrane glutamic endopeptidase [unclassified Rubrivirga]MDT0632111.1 CPBP family intramembrane glutamic endopeptidase [Rubrivirga sp. F394]MDT7856189.1 CPBP family intramembrane glutamic endopeptidase [Rubrivirga sp. S365]
MIDRFQAEWQALRAALRGLSPAARQAIVVLLAATLLVLLQLQVGSRRFYRDVTGNVFGFEDIDLGAWAWWFGSQGVTGFVLPALLLLLAFRWRPAEAGLGLGDWRLAGALALAYVPLVVVGTWVLSDGAAFQAQYPHYDVAKVDWGAFLIYEALFLFYWVGWEYLWRGFVLFGTAPALGAPLAIVVQTVPFAILHAQKPPAEAYLSVLGGLALGALVWRCRSFWIAVPIHAAQMVALDLWATLRFRTGASGVGLEALARALGGAG